jgi:hypothetical protein
VTSWRGGPLITDFRFGPHAIRDGAEESQSRNGEESLFCDRLGGDPRFFPLETMILKSGKIEPNRKSVISGHAVQTLTEKSAGRLPDSNKKNGENPIIEFSPSRNFELT